MRALVYFFLLVAGTVACKQTQERVPSQDVAEEVELPELKKLDFGDDFFLTDQHGASFDSRALRGRVVLLFFGFTTCPDACPTTLSKLSQVYDLLGEAREQLQVVWVSVDPERDTPDRIKAYLEYWQMPVIGLTGTPEEVNRVAAGGYGVYYKRSEEETEAGYLVDHTTLVYLIDPDGDLRYLSQPGDSATIIAGLIQKVLAEGA